LKERLSFAAGPADLDEWRKEVSDLGSAMKALSACGLGMAAPFITESLLRYFPEQAAKYINSRK
jgi:NADH:ubiquinone oxidoreductase subunit F (NADH-binding)